MQSVGCISLDASESSMQDLICVDKLVYSYSLQIIATACDRCFGYNGFCYKQQQACDELQFIIL